MSNPTDGAPLFQWENYSGQQDWVKRRRVSVTPLYSVFRLSERKAKNCNCEVTDTLRLFPDR